MDRAQEISESLARAGVAQLFPAARAHLASRLSVGLTHGTNNVAGLRASFFGCSKTEGAESLATFPTLDDGTRAAVANAFRAAPRNWGDQDDAALARLGLYPARRSNYHIGPPNKIPVPVRDGGIRYVSPDEALRSGAVRKENGSWDLSSAHIDGVPLGEFKWSYLIPGYGPYALVRDYFAPSEDAEATFRGLVADWEGYERLGVGTTILVGEKDPVTGLDRISARADLVDWRRFRDAWKAGKSEAIVQLNSQVSASNKVRKYLAEYKIIDPALADSSHDRKGVDIEKGTAALADSATVDKWCKGMPLCDWMTKPGQKCVVTPIGCVPENILWVVGIGVGVTTILSIAGAVRAIVR